MNNASQYLTALAWLVGGLVVIAGAHLAEDTFGADEGPTPMPSTSPTPTATPTSTPIPTPTPTPTRTPTPSPPPTATPTPTPTPDPSPTPTPSPDAFDRMVWPFAEAQAPAGSMFSLLGLWPPNAGPAPQHADVTWTNHSAPRIGLWQATTPPAGATLGAMTVSPSPGTGPAFGAGNWCVLAQIFVFDEDGEVILRSHPAGAPAMPYQDANGGSTLAYRHYYLGDAETSPDPSCKRIEEESSLASSAKTQLRGVLAGLQAGEAATTQIPCSGILAFGCLSWDTESLFATVRVDDVRPAA